MDDCKCLSLGGDVDTAAALTCNCSCCERQRGTTAGEKQSRRAQGKHRGRKQQRQPHNSPNVEGCTAGAFAQGPRDSSGTLRTMGYSTHA